jgi:outer membrane protein insertion porin family
LYSLAKDYILSLEGQVGYGKSYGDHDALPFFENYTAGGPYTVRGFRENTLGPLDSNRRPLGGNLKVVGNIEIILPVPFAKKINSFRLSTFLDIGNVYGVEEDFEMSALRYATGLAAIWLSPLGILNFSLAKPLNDKAGDQLQLFQFSIGTTF